MSSLQKQKQGKPEDEQKKQPGDKPVADPKLTKAVEDSKDLLAKLDQASKRKRGHYEVCCGVRVWVED